MSDLIYLIKVCMSYMGFNFTSAQKKLFCANQGLEYELGLIINNVLNGMIFLIISSPSTVFIFYCTHSFLN